MKTGQTTASSSTPVGFPDADSLAALRGWYAGLSSRAAVEHYPAARKAAGQSARGMLGHIRRQLIVFANSRHRPDLADVFQHAPRRATGARGCRRTRDPALAHAAGAEAPDQRQHRPVAVSEDRQGTAGVRYPHPLGADRAHSPPAWLVESHRGLGMTGARQVEAFFAAHPQLTERARALIPIIQPSGIVPWEQLRLPNEVDGSQGNFRAPRNACTLNATNDYEAVQARLALHETVATQRAYRKEAARLILWAIVERGRALSSLTTDDAIAYRAFVRHPTPRERWVGPPRPRDSVEWRPFSGGLSARSAAYALTVLSALFRWLIEQRYVLANPFAGVKVRGHALRPALDTARGFTEENGYCCAPLQTAWNGPTAGPSRQHNACASCSTSAMPRACALANWSAPSSGNVRLDEHGDHWLHLVGKGGKPR